MKGGIFIPYVPVPKDLTTVKTKVAFNLSVSLYALDLRPLSLFRHTFLRAARLAQPARL